MMGIRALALVVFLVGSTAAAHAGVVRYLGPHPLAPGVGKGMCYIEGPHVHSYFPHKALLYVRTGSAFVFIGDPVEFEIRDYNLSLRKRDAENVYVEVEGAL